MIRNTDDSRLSALFPLIPYLRSLRSRSSYCTVLRPLGSARFRMRRRQRLLDVALVSGGVVVFAPLMLALAAAIRLEDGGDVFFIQQRVGEGRQPFDILKLRSMRDGDEITRVGRWIRATGLDEVAQFRNVLRGEMRLVGPRPLTAADLDRLGWAGPEVAWRFSVPPGITGLAQVFGAGARQSLALDEAYIRGHSLRLDVELVAVSFAVNVAGKRRMRDLLKAPAARRLRAVRLAREVIDGYAPPHGMGDRTHRAAAGGGDGLVPTAG